MTNPHLLAVGVGTYLTRHIRTLREMRDAVLSGRQPPPPPRDVVARSWSRLQTAGVSPERCENVTLAGCSDLESRRARTPLRAVLRELRNTVTVAIEDANFIFVVADANGVVLWREGARTVCQQADALGFVEGAHWAENSVGTNSVGLAWHYPHRCVVCC